MSVKLRLKRMGSKKRPFYRIVAADSRRARDGRFIESIGYYNPVANPAVVHVDEALAFKWFDRGAQPSTSTASLLKQIGTLQKWNLMKQGLEGEALEKKMESIMAQRTATAATREAKKKGEVSKKAAAKAEAEAEKAAEEKATEEKATEEKAAAAEAPAEEKPAEEAKAEAPAEEAAAEEKPAEEAKAEAPADEAPAEEKPAEEAKAESDDEEEKKSE